MAIKDQPAERFHLYLLLKGVYLYSSIQDDITQYEKDSNPLQSIEQIYDEVDWHEADFFARMRQLGLVKFKIYKQYPYAFNFLKALAQEDAAEVKPIISQLGQGLISRGLERGYQNIDWSKFRDDIDREKMINIINWTMLRFAEQSMDSPMEI